MMKHLLAIIVMMSLVFGIIFTYGNVKTVLGNPYKSPALQSKSAIVMDSSTGKVLFNKAADEKMYPASTTKILTAILALENLNLTHTVYVGNELNYVRHDSSEAGLHKRDKLSVKDLLYALMLPSGDDAAYTIAVNVAREKSGNPHMSVNNCTQYFTHMMNKKAKEIGAQNSNFTNPDGYPNSNHYSTARDIALISREALKNKFFRNVVKTYAYRPSSLHSAISNKPTLWKNTNELIDKKSKFYYSAAAGLKTGYTKDAGYCLASFESSNNSDIIVVTLKSQSEDGRWLDSKALLKYGFHR